MNNAPALVRLFDELMRDDVELIATPAEMTPDNLESIEILAETMRRFHDRRFRFIALSQ